MTQQNELNEELARWAGFKFQELSDLQPKYRHVANLAWIYPTGETNHQLPDFIHSLDAYFKWLVPKLVAEKYRMSITYNNIRRPGEEYMFRVSFCKFKTKSLGKAYGTDLALTVCLAIKKLIDSKLKKVSKTTINKFVP